MMMHRAIRFLTMMVWLAGGISVLASGPPPDEEPGPNIIVFLVDDLGWQDTSVVFDDQASMFQQHFRTPNLERLAERGIRFSRGYAHCVCSPTRTSIMTGQHPARHRVTNWTLHRDRDSSGTTERLAAPRDWRMQGIQPDTPTLAGHLQASGYRTIHAGKAHWGAIGTPGSDPCSLGFDVNIAGHSAGAPGSYQSADQFDKPGNRGPRSVWAVPGLEKYHDQEIHLTDALAREAVSAIDDAVAADQPFFLYFAPYAVHTPLQPHPRFIDHYRGQTYPGTGREIPENEAVYASMVEGFDDALGQLLDALRDRNVADRTLIVFTSDNGGLSAHTRQMTPYETGRDTHNHPLREGKGSAYEGGIRVPLVVAWATPDAGSRIQQRIPVARGIRTATPVVPEDLMPTICHWAGVPLSEAESAGDRPPRDGRDFTPWLTGAQPDAERALLFHYPHVWGPAGAGYQPHSSLQYGGWKAIWFYDTRTWELYCLSGDPGEQDNLANRRPDRLAELAERLIQELDDRQAQYPVLRETGEMQPVEWPDRPPGNDRNR